MHKLNPAIRLFFLVLIIMITVRKASSIVGLVPHAAQFLLLG
ncbi:hypothetical protein VVMO6_02700 [Vibrio vulnificus MO6-24/O]|nr:hypothetical protein VVMO6_02700 [Vibrio vulnificus MO6-24/O]